MRTQAQFIGEILRVGAVKRLEPSCRRAPNLFSLGGIEANPINGHGKALRKIEHPNERRDAVLGISSIP
jgi:hypothetical protein